MKFHKMSNKQFAKFVFGLQKQAMKSPLLKVYKYTDKYDYNCRKAETYSGYDWQIGRKIGGSDGWFTLWAFHNNERHAWTVYEGDKVYEYLDSDLEKAVQDG